MDHDPPAQPELTPPPLTLRRVLIGPDGLRAGWSLLLYGLLFVLTLSLLTFLLNLTHLLPSLGKAQTETPAAIVLIGQLLQVVAYLLPALLVSRVERRPFTRYGLSPTCLLPDFAAGFLTGLTALSLLVATLVFTHALTLEGLALHGLHAFRYAFVWAFAFFLVGFAEEFLFRGFLQYTLARGIASLTRTLDPGTPHAPLIGFLISAFLLSIVFFALAHLGNPGENSSGILAVALAGAVFAFSLYRTGSLWWAIGFHTAWDWAQSFLYGTPDSGARVAGHLFVSHPSGPTWLSGGPAGPEGSLLVIPTLLLVALVIHLTLPRRSYPFP